MVRFLGYKLRNLRQAKKLSMLDLNEITGISQSTLSDIENEKKNPREATVKLLCEGLKVDEQYFYLDDAVLPTDLLPDLPNETKQFLLESDSVPYIVLGEKAKKEGIPADLLHSIIDTIINHKKQ